MRLASHY
ncbi:hypothetical protein BpHYR1_009503 [Brachionus plicatilis]|nr:hypothetical protein BpHYR1_009503 [Brachionus plicatilis]